MGAYEAYATTLISPTDHHHHNQRFLKQTRPLPLPLSLTLGTLSTRITIPLGCMLFSVSEMCQRSVVDSGQSIHDVRVQVCMNVGPYSQHIMCEHRNYLFPVRAISAKKKL